MRSIVKPPFAPSLMESTRAIGYSLESAIADLIDNCITAHATRIDVDFFPIGESFVSILDNGDGMNEDELITAMEYGSKNPNDVREASDLGRYGLGLKTASLSQCSKLTVISKKNDTISGASWDLNHIYKTLNWDLLLLDKTDFDTIPNIDKLKSQIAGTLVVWQNLDKMKVGEIDFASSLSKKMDLVRNHISLVFHRFLTGETNLKKTDIYMNNMRVDAHDPFLIKKSTQLMAEETISIDGAKIIVKPYILPHVSKMSNSEIKSLGGTDGLRKKQGFYVYRNKRLLIWGTWFRLMRQGELSKLARVQVDIPNSLDNLWTLDIKKSTAIPPEEVRKNLANIVEKIAEGSKRTWTYRGKKEVDDNNVNIWNRIKTANGGYLYLLNRNHEIINAIIEKESLLKPALEALFKQIETSIPLNQLYADMSNDAKIENESEIPEKEIKISLEQMLSIYNDKIQKSEFLERISKIEPFVLYPNIVNKVKEEL